MELVKSNAIEILSRRSVVIKDYDIGNGEEEEGEEEEEEERGGEEGDRTSLKIDLSMAEQFYYEVISSFEQEEVLLKHTFAHASVDTPLMHHSILIANLTSSLSLRPASFGIRVGVSSPVGLKLAPLRVGNCLKPKQFRQIPLLRKKSLELRFDASEPEIVSRPDLPFVPFLHDDVAPLSGFNHRLKVKFVSKYR